ncbi:carboxypeptidase-like regulatory domain-containing protein [Arcticibacter svalbardensis]|nr:carboxypeptidase-like regulatory domain-containing protein [Arcticibacter svalbardensis]
MNSILQRSLCFLFLFLVWTNIPAYAQQVVKGKISNAKDNLPVIGASLQVKGTKIGVQTNVDCNFQLNAPMRAVLVITYIVRSEGGGGNFGPNSVGSDQLGFETLIYSK